MGDFCAIIGVLAVSILVVAVVGHVLWLIMAAIYRAIVGVDSHDGSEATARLGEEGITAKKLQQLHREGRIDVETFHKVLGAMQEQSLGHPPMIPIAQRLSQPPAPVVMKETATLRETAPPPLPVPPPLPAAPRGMPVVPREVIPFQAAPPRQAAPPPPPPRPLPLPPPPPRKPFSEIFKRFMEESNIRWGELIGGLLIIGCSIALVLTFWEKIATQPWLRFFLFTAVTSAIFGTGLYTEHRWKLPTTSRGLLIIATLLVPLNFLAFSRGGASTGAAAQEAVALLLFAWLVWTAGKVLAAEWAIPLVIGVLGPSIVQSLIGRWLTTAAPGEGMVLLLAIAAVAFYAVCNGWVINSARKSAEIDWPKANHTLIVLGASTLAMILPLGALALKANDWIGIGREISPVLTLAAAPMLAMGLMLWRRVKALDMAGVQTVGIALAALAACVLVGGIALSWPDPARMMAAALLAFVTFTVIAIAFEIPAAHVPALACFGIVYLLAVHLALHHITWSAQMDLERIFVSVTAGSSLLGLVGVLAIVTDWLFRRKRIEARFYSLATVAFGGISLVLVTLYGFTRSADHGASWVYLGYAIIAMWLAWRIERSEATWIAAGLLAMACAQAIVFRFAVGRNLLDRWMLATLLHGSILIVGMLITWLLDRKREPILTRPLSNGALASSIIASVLIVVALIFFEPMPSLILLAMRAAWIAVMLLGISLVYISPSIFSAFQTALAAAVVLCTAGALEHREWFINADHPLVHPWTLQTVAISLAMLALAWTIVRLIIRRLVREPENRLRQLLNPTWLSVDALVVYIALVVLVLSSLLSIAPAVAHELASKIGKPLGQLSLPLMPAGAGRAWILLGSIVVAFSASLWVKFRRSAILSLLIAVACGCGIAAASFDSTTSGASALRWMLAMLLVLGSLLLWLREAIAQLASGARWPEFEYEHTDLDKTIRGLLLALTAAPILVTTLYCAAQALGGTTTVGPAAGTFFSRIGESANYLVPLALMMAIFVGHAWRERSDAFALAAAVLLNLTVSLAYMLYLVRGQQAIEGVQVIHLIQFNAIAAAIFSLAWIFTLKERAPALLLIVQAAFAPFILLSLLAVLILQLVFNPASVPPAAREAAGVFGCLGWILAAAAIFKLIWSHSRRISSSAITLLLLIASSLASLRLVNATGRETWLAYHGLLAFSAVSAWLMLGLGAISQWKKIKLAASRDEITIHTLLLAAVTLGLSIRCLFGDPGAPWWTVYGLLALSPLAIALAFWSMQSFWLYPAAILLNIALTIGWIFGRHPAMPSPFLGLVQLNIISLAFCGAAFLVLELYILRPLRWQVVHVGFAAFHHFAAIVSLVAMIFIAVTGIAADVLSLTATTNPTLTWGAPAAALLVLLATLWDRDARYSLVCLYVMGLASAAIVLHEFHLRLSDLAWLWVVITAGYSVLVSYLYMFRARLAQFGESIRVAPREDWPIQSPLWVGAITLSQGVFIFVISFFAIQLLGSQMARLAVAAGAISMALALGLLAHDSRQDRLRRATLTLGLFGVILWGWAWLPRYGPDVFLNRVVIVMVVMAAMSVFYAIGMVKILRRENDWTGSARKLAPLMGIGTLLSLVLVFVSEGITYRPGIGAAMALWAFAAVAIALIAMCVAALICAIVPGRDPLNLSERGRQAYVYGTQFLLVLLFVHVALVYPRLLNAGIWSRFWPIILMLLAFIGIGLSEFFRRQGRSVLAEPLENTSLLLPLLPVITFWMLAGVWNHEEHVNYAVVLLLAAAAYGSLAVLRRSFIFGLLAALAGNGALWYLLYHTPNMGFLQHPQLWLIPISFSILAAAYLNRARLAAEHMRNVRYVCLMAIYASSTADIMINGINQSPWLPMVLALLAVAGVMGGIVMRVQSFLFLGTLFLLIAIATMIQYAAHRVGQNWPWLVAGILLGSAIIVLFALFEKKRAEMLSLVDGLKEWQA